MYFIEFSPVIQLNKYSIEDISDASLNSAEVRKKKVPNLNQTIERTVSKFFKYRLRRSNENKVPVPDA